MQTTQTHFCKLTILLSWTRVSLRRQRKDPEQMYLQQQERPQFAALHSPDATKKNGKPGLKSKHLTQKACYSSSF